METLQLGTHNSATGENPSDIISHIGSLIGQCQNKTIYQQLKAGVRLFDLRVKPYRHATRYNFYYPLENIKTCTLGHGLCDYDINLQEAVTKINDYGKERGIEMYVLVTLEGEIAEAYKDKYLGDVQQLLDGYSHVVLLEVNIKKPKWAQLWRNPKSKITYVQEYPMIVGWKALFPFPKFWNRLIDYRPQLKTNEYSLRDFV